MAEVEEIRHDVMPLSSDEVDYPAVREMERASALETPAEVQAWRASVSPPFRRPRGPVTPLPAAQSAAGRNLGETIQHRGSTRRFSHAPLTAVELATVLWWATRPVELDVVGGLVDPFLIVNAVEGVDPGAYRYWPESHGLELVRAGEFRKESAFLCLEQALGGDAAAVLYFLAPLDAILSSAGNRGYRLVNLQAGLAGGRAYLAAYAQRFGASGLTFYDGQVVEFLSPHAAGLDAVFVTALGRAARAPW